MGELWKGQDRKLIVTKKENLKKKKQKCLFLCRILTLFFYVYPQGDWQAKKSFNLSWLGVQMSYQIFNNLDEFLNRHFFR